MAAVENAEVEVKIESVEPDPEVGLHIIHSESQNLGAESEVSEFEKELPLAAEMKKNVEFILSKSFYYMRYSVFRQAFPDIKDPEFLKERHKSMISDVKSYIQEKVQKLLNDTQLISSLNDLDKMRESQPITFDAVWRPSGDPHRDVEDHIRPIVSCYKDLFEKMLNNIQQENERKMTEIEKYEQEILALVDDIRLAADRPVGK